MQAAKPTATSQDATNAIIRNKIETVRAIASSYTATCRLLVAAGCTLAFDDQLFNVIDAIEMDFMLASYQHTELKLYHRAMMAVNPCMRCDDVMAVVRDECSRERDWMVSACKGGMVTKEWCVRTDEKIESILQSINRAIDIVYKPPAEKKRSRACDCGHPMRVVPESAEMHCDHCGRVKTISGSASEAAVTESKHKCNGKEIIRHFKFWMERLQAIENVTFPQELIDSVMYVLARDRYTISRLTVPQMRTVLKDPKVAATSFNDHAPALIKRVGGPAPPIHTYDDLEVTKSRFIRVMTLHDQINPIAGNKPYYPHFIYKIIEEQHKNDKDKLRTLEYIHMQTEDTVVKNDNTYKQICQLANDPGSGLVYRPTKTLR